MTRNRTAVRIFCFGIMSSETDKDFQIGNAFTRCVVSMDDLLKENCKYSYT